MFRVSEQSSHCPACGRQLTWSENVPILSWLLQRGRCRGCGGGISLRYPLVEALNCGLWLWAAFWTGDGEWGLLAIRLTVLSGLLVATFVDFDCFEIPDEVSIGGMLLAPLCALAVPALHRDTALARHFSAAEVVSRGEVDRLAHGPSVCTRRHARRAVNPVVTGCLPHLPQCIRGFGGS